MVLLSVLILAVVSLQIAFQVTEVVIVMQQVPDQQVRMFFIIVWLQELLIQILGRITGGLLVLYGKTSKHQASSIFRTEDFWGQDMGGQVLKILSGIAKRVHG